MTRASDARAKKRVPATAKTVRSVPKSIETAPVRSVGRPARPVAVNRLGGRPDANPRPGSAATLEKLREMILCGELAPNSVVSQLTLARTLGISTTPLREVIRELQAEGLLEVQLNRRPRVAPLDIDDLQGVYAGRIMFESLAIALTVPVMTEDDHAALRGDLEEMHALAEDGDHAEWGRVHVRFHRRLVFGAPSSIAGTMSNLMDRAERYRRLMSLPRMPRGLGDAETDHTRITEACINGNGTLAASELAYHLAQTALSLSAAYAPEVDPAAVRQAVRMVSGRTDPPGPRWSVVR